MSNVYLSIQNSIKISWFMKIAWFFFFWVLWDYPLKSYRHRESNAIIRLLLLRCLFPTKKCLCTRILFPIIPAPTPSNAIGSFNGVFFVIPVLPPVYYRGVEYHEKKMSWNTPLPLNLSQPAIASNICQGLYVKCYARKTVDAGLYHWHVNVVVDGKLARTGVLIHDSWVFVKRTAAKLEYDNKPI